MKRSERYYRDARALILQAATSISIGTAAAIWAYVKMLDQSTWSLGLGFAALAAFGWAVLTGREAIHSYRVGVDIERDEFRRAIRPRI